MNARIQPYDEVAPSRRVSDARSAPAERPKLNPKGPKGLSRLIARLRLAWDPLHAPVRLLHRYGDFVEVSPQRYLTRDPAVVEAVMSDYLTFSQDVVQDYTEAGLRFWGNAMQIRNGSGWLRQRRIMQPAFSPARVMAYAQTMVDHTQYMLSGWQDGDSFDLLEQLKHLTLGLVIDNVMGVALSTQEMAQIAEALEATLELFADLSQMELKYATAEKQRFYASVAVLDAIVYRVIGQRRAAQQDHGDMLSAWLKSTDEQGKQLTDVELRDEIVAHLRAGYRNSATALTWVFALLARHPQVAGRLMHELDSVLRGRAPDLTSLMRVPYVEKVLKEGMRLYPLYPTIARSVQHDTELFGYPLRAGSAICISVWAMHRDPRYFPQPERFDPQRWTEELERGLPKAAFSAFGGGPRQCPFKSYAMLEMSLALAMISQRFSVELAPEEQAIPQWSMNGLVPQGGLEVVVRERSRARDQV
jgi:cytochrome P450